MEMNYASKGQGDAALATGIVGTVLGGLNAIGNGGGLLGGLGGNGAAGAALMAGVAGHALGSNNQYVTKGEFELQKQISTLQMEKAILAADQASENKMVEVYRQSRSELKAAMDKEDARHDAQMAWNAQQMVNNANMSAAIAANAASIDALKCVTKVVVPNTAICPGWGEVTVAPVTPT